MDIAPTDLVRGFFIACLAAVALWAFGASHPAPVHASAPLTAEDSPAPDDGGDSSDEESDPEEEPAEEPTSEPAPEPTQEPTASADDDQSTVGSNDDSSRSDDESNDDQAAAGSTPDDRGNGAATVTGSVGEPDDATADDTTKASAKKVEPVKSGWSSSLGWALLIGGLASSAGAFTVYRRDPAVLARPWFGHAH